LICKKKRRASTMAAVVHKGSQKVVVSGDLLLAILIGAGVVIGDFILRHLPF